MVFTERSLFVRVAPNALMLAFGRFSWAANPSQMDLHEAIQGATSFSGRSRCKTLKGQAMLRSEEFDVIECWPILHRQDRTAPIWHRLGGQVHLRTRQRPR